MVHYLYVNVDRLVNLTKKKITAYSDTGDFVTIPPNSGAFGNYYIVDEWTGRPDELRATEEQTGRNNTKVSQLFLFSNEEIRVIPTGE